MKRIFLAISLVMLLVAPGVAMAQENVLTIDPDFLVRLGERELVAFPAEMFQTPEEASMACGPYFIDSPYEPDGKHRLGMNVARAASDPMDVDFFVAFEYGKFHVVVDDGKAVPTVRFILQGAELGEIQIKISSSDLTEATCLQELEKMPRPPVAERPLFKLNDAQKAMNDACGEYFIEVPSEREPLMMLFLNPTAEDPTTLLTLVFPKWKIRAVVERGKVPPTVQYIMEGTTVTSVIIRMTAEELAMSPCLANIPPKPKSVD